MIKTAIVAIKKGHPALEETRYLCYASARIKNAVNSLCRAAFFHGSDSFREDIPKEYGYLDEIVSGNFKVTNIYYLKAVACDLNEKMGLGLPKTLSKRPGDKVTQNWRSYFALLKAYKKGRLKGKPKPPGYIRKTYSQAECANNFKPKPLRDDSMLIPTGFTHGVRVPGFAKDIQSFQIVPINSNYFEYHIRYRVKEEAPKKKTGPKRYAGIDLGINRIMTVGFSDLRQGVMIPGGRYKAVNKHANRLIDSLNSKYDKEQGEGVKELQLNANRYASLHKKRKLRLKHLYTTDLSKLANHLDSSGVTDVVIGWNEGFKSDIKMGRKTNRKFAELPLREMVDYLTVKLKERGIGVHEREESYTSKASFLDNDVIPTYVKGDNANYLFSGTRYKGCYTTKEGKKINSDLNGALNILRKHDASMFNGLHERSTRGNYSLVAMPSVRRLDLLTQTS